MDRDTKNELHLLDSLLKDLKYCIFNSSRDFFSSLDEKKKDEICKYAAEQNTGNVLYYYHKDKLPEKWQDIFSQEFISSSARELHRSHDLKELLSAFGKMNIDVALLKGNDVAYRAYVHPGLRMMGDIDVLVKKNNVEKAYNYLLDKGYVQTNEAPHPYHKPALRSKRGNYIELHYHIMHDQTKVTEDVIWEDSSQSKLFEEKVIFLSPEIALLHTIQHAMRDKLVCGLKVFLDTAYIIRSLQPDQGKLLDISKRSGLYDHYRIFMNIYPGFFPDDYKLLIEPADVKIIKDARLLIENFPLLRDLSNQELAFGHSFASSTLKEKMRFIMKSIFKNRATIAYKYNSENKFPEIYYWYAVSIFEGTMKFFKYLTRNRKDDIKKQIGQAQKSITELV